jgi:PTS system mannose-specific IIA component
MRRFLIASHGHLASGLKSSIKILTRDDSMVKAVDCYIDESDFTPKIQDFIDSVQPDDEAIIFTDLMGGSVCNKVMTLKPELKGIMHVTGVNLITILGCILADEKLTPDSVDQIVLDGSSMIKRIEPSLDEAGLEETSSDDFFA